MGFSRREKQRLISLDFSSGDGYYDLAMGWLCKWNSNGTKAWTRQWGAVSYDRGEGVAVDSNGNIFVTGHSDGDLDGNTNMGVDSADIFLTKWNPDGTKAWTKLWGTTGDDYGDSVAVDNSGNIYVTGSVKGTLDGNTNACPFNCAAYPRTLIDAFITKWNANGTMAWTKQWGTESEDYGTSITIDSVGNVYVAGETYSSLDGNINAGSMDILLTKWDADGTKIWTKQWGTSSWDQGNSVSVDSGGSIFVTGYTYGSLDGNTNAGSEDIFLTKWNPDGTKAWTNLWGSPSADTGNSITVDAMGNLFIAGTTTGSLDGNTNAGKGDIFLAKWNSDGTKAWTKQWGTIDPDSGQAVAIYDTNVFVVGYTYGSLDGNICNKDIYDECSGEIFLTIFPAE